MGGGGTTELPSRSPDHTPCDKFLRVDTRDKAYREAPRTMADLKTKMHRTIQTADQDALKIIFQKYENSVEFCCTRTGLTI